jgi:hypothetical protein
MNLQEMTVDEIKVHIYDLMVQYNLIAGQIREAEEEWSKRNAQQPQSCCGPQPPA